MHMQYVPHLKDYLKNLTKCFYLSIKLEMGTLACDVNIAYATLTD